MSPSIAKYSCDECRLRKVKCSRETPICAYCVRHQAECVYSRSGIIRRRPRRSRKVTLSENTLSTSGQPSHADESDAESRHDAAPPNDQPQIVADIIDAQETIEKSTSTSVAAPLHALASLDAEYSLFWVGNEDSGPRERRFFAFDGELADSLINTYTAVLAKGEPFFTVTPSDIIRDLALNPAKIREGARLVIFYGILLTSACQDESCDESLRSKLRWNLRMALNDARLLLEPSDIGIQALVMTACHVQDLTTPSLCWMLVTNACRMLQGLGIHHRNIDRETRDRRIDLFWSLNVLDKSLAIIFGRPPTFHAAMCKTIPPVPFERLLRYQPHISSPHPGDAGAMGPKSDTRSCGSLFGAHYMSQTHRLSNVSLNVWSFLHDETGSIDIVKTDLDNWYQETTEVLRAVLVAESPLLDDSAITAMQLGLANVHFQYHFLTVLLIRSQKAWKQACISSAREALIALDGLVSDSLDVFNGVVWQLLFCPFTPFFVLLGHVLSDYNDASTDLSIAAMNRLPYFLQRMEPRHSRAAKLHKISSAIATYAVQHRASARARKQCLRADCGDADGQRHSMQPQAAQAATGNVGIVEEARPALHSLDGLFSEDYMQALPMCFSSPTDGQNWDFSSLAQDFPAFQSTNGISEASQTYDLFAQSTFDWLDWDSDLTLPT